jgi:hypothetical protein
MDFKDLATYRGFRGDAVVALKSAVHRFFNCEVEFIPRARPFLRECFGVELLDNPGRGFYPVNDSEVVIVGRVLVRRDLASAFCLHLKGGHFATLHQLLTAFEGSLTYSLSRSYRLKFQDAPMRFGDQLIELFVAKFFSRGRYDYKRFLYLVLLFQKLCATQFEGRFFNTGLILTRSHHAFAEQGDDSRSGTEYPLTEPLQMQVGDVPNKRFWYLADGVTSFFICSRSLLITSLFILSDATSNPQTFMGNHALGTTLRGSDALFRVMGPAEFSITHPKKIEFVFKDNFWRLRNLPEFKKRIQDYGLNAPAAEALLFWVSALSRRRQSALIWLYDGDIANSALLITKNYLTRASLSLGEPTHAPTVARILTSDGATIIGSDLTIRAYGCIVDSSQVKSSGARGSGESVASTLGAYGLAIKVSQDGNAKIFLGQVSVSIQL